MDGSIKFIQDPNRIGEIGFIVTPFWIPEFGVLNVEFSKYLEVFFNNICNNSKISESFTFSRKEDSVSQHKLNYGTI